MARDGNLLLVVEDSADLRMLITEMFEDEGYRVVSAEDGQQALEYLQSTQELPGVILLDLMMPKMDGFAFRAEQRKDPRLMSIPVVLMSAADDLEDKKTQVSAAACISKPFADISAILDAMSAFFPPSGD